MRVQTVFNGLLAYALLVLIPTHAVAEPVCTAAAVNIQNGWGWENNASCMSAAVAVPQSCVDTHPVGDGWGWDGVQSCRVSVSTGSTGSTETIPVCVLRSSDGDGDGYGWENASSCVVTETSGTATVSPPVVPTVPNSEVGSAMPVCVNPASDPDGDGYGWEQSRSCIVSNPDDTPGTDNSNSVSSSIPVCVSADSDPDGDGYGWENSGSCVVGEPVVIEVPVVEEPEPEIVDTEVTVPELPANNTPVAFDDQAIARPDEPVMIDVLSNDSDPDGDPLMITSVTQPANGAVEINADGIVYTSVSGFDGTDSFTYQISDGNDGNATATVLVDVEFMLTLRNSFGDPDKIDYVTEGNFAVLWDNTFDHRAEAEVIAQVLNDIRSDVLDKGLQDPSPIAQGFYYNTYIHHKFDDSFPIEWGNSPLIDSEGNPYLTIWFALASDMSNLYHEAFHVFQPPITESAFSPTLASEWYKEASAVWYAAEKRPSAPNAFLYSEVVRVVPHLELWRGYRTDGDPETWSYRTHRYGMSAFLSHLSQVESVGRTTMIEGYEKADGLTPLEYLVQELGVEPMQESLVNWAVGTVVGPDYISDEQKAIAVAEVVRRADPEYLFPNSLTIAEDTFGTWVQPEPGIEPRGWGYNVVKVSDAEAGDLLQVAFEGDESGSNGAASHFMLRSIVVSSAGSQVSAIDVVDGLTGTDTIEILEDDSEVYFVVAALPDFYRGAQTYSYSIRIDKLN